MKFIQNLVVGRSIYGRCASAATMSARQVLDCFQIYDTHTQSEQRDTITTVNHLAAKLLLNGCAGSSSSHWVVSTKALSLMVLLGSEPCSRSELRVVPSSLGMRDLSYGGNLTFWTNLYAVQDLKRLDRARIKRGVLSLLFNVRRMQSN